MNAMNGLIFNTDNYRFIMFSEYNKVYIIICDINYSFSSECPSSNSAWSCIITVAWLD